MEKSTDQKVPAFERLIYQICQEEGIDVQFLSRNWVLRLQKGDEVHYVVGYKFDLNSQGTGLVADDKFATFEALERAGVPVIQHEILYELSDQTAHALGYNSMPYIISFFQKHNRQIIIKANNGTCGRQVFKVTNLDQLIEVLPRVFKQSYSASMCPFYDIRHEYRMILLDGEEKLSYSKVKNDDAYCFNLDCGAQAVAMPQERHAEVLTLAQRAARAINLRFGSVDVIETADGELMVLEINSGVMTRHYLEQHPDKLSTVQEMYREAVRKMFGKIC